MRKFLGRLNTTDWLVLSLSLLGVLVASCTPTAPEAPPLPTSVINCTVTGNGNVNCGGSQVVTQPASPAPGSGGLPAGSSVKIGAFGQNCPSGVVAPSDAHVLKLSCQTALTCTPKGPDGKLLEPAVTGVVPEFFGVKNGASVVSANPWEDEAFNLNLVGKTIGEFDIGCTVKGVSADLWHGRVVVADATGFGMDNVTASSRVVYDELKLEDFGKVK